MLAPASVEAREELVRYAEAACIRCGRCCNLGQNELIWRDLRKLKKALKLSTSELIKKYGLVKRGRAWWLTTPCPFLKNDNHCTVYEARPRCCRWFPMRLYLIRQNDPRSRNWLSICKALEATVEHFGGET